MYLKNLPLSRQVFLYLYCMITRETIKHITSLREKKYRELYGEFVVEGEKTVAELLNSSFEALAVYAVESWISKNARLAQNHKITFTEITDKELERISNFTTPNKVVAVAKTKKATLPEFASSKGFTLMLDDIRDPGNFGTILRTADWFGFDTIVCSETTVDLYNPKVIQASMGSFLRVNVVYGNLKNILQKHSEIPVLGAFMDGVPVHDVENTVKSRFVIIGNEANGISKELHSLITHKISVPLIPHGNSRPESMNAAVAAGIVMYELSRK